MDELVGQRWRRAICWTGIATLALSVGCKSAPIDGKSCPCTAGFTCCDSSQLCVVEGTQCPPSACNSVPPPSLTITQQASPLPSDAGPPPEVMFGQSSPQWVSYTYGGTGYGEDPPTLEATPDGNGFHVVATSIPSGGSTNNAYEGVGLTFASSDCIDGTMLTGIQFTLEGDLGHRLLALGVTSSDDLDSSYDRGTCTAGPGNCFGPTYVCCTQSGMYNVPFTLLADGKPHGDLDPGHIVNVQWALLPDSSPQADFTIKNVKFY